MSMKLYRPGPHGLEPNPVEVKNWRRRLRSRRWQPASLSNPEVQPTSTGMAVLFWLGLALVTFVTLLVGYGIGFWGPLA